MNKIDKVFVTVKAFPQELFDHLVSEYKREEDLKRNLQRLKILMSKTYISKLIH